MRVEEKEAEVNGGVRSRGEKEKSPTPNTESQEPENDR